MHLDGAFAYPHLRCRFLVQQARRDQDEKFALASGQRLQAPFEVVALSMFHTQPARALDSPRDRSQQRSFLKRLLEDIDGACPHGVNCYRQIAASGNKDERDEVAGRRKSFLKLQTVHSRQKDVGYNAINIDRVFLDEEFVGRRVRSYFEASSVELEGKSVAGAGVIDHHRHANAIGRRSRTERFSTGNRIHLLPR